MIKTQRGMQRESTDERGRSRKIRRENDRHTQRETKWGR